MDTHLAGKWALTSRRIDLGYGPVNGVLERKKIDLLFIVVLVDFYPRAQCRIHSNRVIPGTIWSFRRGGMKYGGGDTRRHSPKRRTTHLAQLILRREDSHLVVIFSRRLCDAIDYLLDGAINQSIVDEDQFVSSFTDETQRIGERSQRSRVADPVYCWFDE